MTPAAAAAAAREHDKKLLYFAGGAIMLIALATAFASIAIMRSALQNVKKHRRAKQEYRLQAADLKPLGHQQEAIIQHAQAIQAATAEPKHVAKKANRKAHRPRKTRPTTKKVKKTHRHTTTRRKTPKVAKKAGHAKKQTKSTTPKVEEQKSEDADEEGEE